MASALELQLDAGPNAASEARIALGDLERELSAELLKDVRLMVSELVTNSIRHAGLGAGDAVHLHAWLAHDHFRIEVADSGPGFARVGRARAGGTGDDEGGWGLYIVQSLADRWGTQRCDGVSRVWFEIDIGGRERRPPLNP